MIFLKKPWSLSTTVRNPSRIIYFLNVLKELEGKFFDTQNQKNFQVLLIKNKLYTPSNLTEKEKEYFDLDKGMTFEQANQIFIDHKYVDPAMRGRQSFAILKKMGLCVGSKSSMVEITNFGKDMLNSSNDLGDLLFIYFIKWQLPNPIDTKFEKGFNIKPFLGTLHLINKVNHLWENEGEDPVGISKEEFLLFVPTLIDYKEIKNQAEQLICYRKLNSNDRKTFKIKFAKKFLGEDDLNKVEKLLSNLKDYGDNTIRYFRLTRYIQIRGNGFYVDLEKRRMIEILKLLEFDDASPNKLTEMEYLDYLSDKNKPELPWNKEDVLVKILDKLKQDVSELCEELVTLGIPVPENPDLEGISLREEIDILKVYFQTLQKNKQYHDMIKEEEILNCIHVLENIRSTVNKPSVELEKQASLALMALNDAKEIKPNYPVGDDGEPTFTAPGGVSDIECYYTEFNLICEVTMLTDRSQWYNEGQPIMRHLREFEYNNKDKISYCMFIAPKIHVDTINTFWNAVKYEYRGDRQKIIPLTISLFIQLLLVLKKYKNKNNKVFPHKELMKLYGNIINITETVNNSDEWLQKIPHTIKEWEQCILK